MDLRVLNYFLTVAREKTISKAALTLHVSQPTLSKQLQELENELGVQLFKRGNREITLTEEGVFLQNRGKEILDLVNLTTNNLQKTEVISGDIMIGSGETHSFQFLSVILNNLMTQYPDLKVHLYSGNADDIKEKIDTGLLDFGLIIDPVEKQKYEYMRLPLSDQWGILVNKKHALANKKCIYPSDLITLPLIISNQSLVDNQLSEWLGGNLNKFNIVGTYNLLYNASLLVKEGNIAALCIDGVINTKESSLIFIPFEPLLTANTNIIWKKKQTFSHAAKIFLKSILSENA